MKFGRKREEGSGADLGHPRSLYNSGFELDSQYICGCGQVRVAFLPWRSMFDVRALATDGLADALTVIDVLLLTKHSVSEFKGGSSDEQIQDFQARNKASHV